MPRKALVTMGDGAASATLEVARPTFERYAVHHGYDVVIADPVADYPAPWAKPLRLRECLDRYDVVLWIDADCLVLDVGEDIAEWLHDHAFQALVEEESGLQTGVWALRASRDADEFLAAVWDMRRRDADDTMWEQGAVNTLMCLGAERDRWRAGTVLLPWRFNAIDGESPGGAAILHVGATSGAPHAQRAERMRQRMSDNERKADIAA